MNRLLLHTCCAPCLSAPLERLVDEFPGETTVFFHNPNIDTPEEYERRLDAVRSYLSRRYDGKVPLIETPYDPTPFREAVRPLSATGERGVRCTLCYYLRLRHTFEEAVRYGMTHAATTLTVSPHKDAARIDAIGAALATHYGVAYLRGDRDERRGRELSRQYDIYRQDHCGCAASAVERDDRRRRRETEKRNREQI